MKTIEKFEARMELALFAKLLLLVGGILLLVAGLFQIADIRYSLDLSPGIRTITSLTSFSSGLLALLVGALALLGTRRTWNPAWNVVLLVLGLLVSGLGGILIFIASLMGLAETYIKK